MPCAWIHPPRPGSWPPSRAAAWCVPRPIPPTAAAHGSSSPRRAASWPARCTRWPWSSGRPSSGTSRGAKPSSCADSWRRSLPASTATKPREPLHEMPPPPCPRRRHRRRRARALRHRAAPGRGGGRARDRGGGPAGRTGSVLVHEGNVVKAVDGSPLVVINRVDPIYVSFSVPEKRLGVIRAAQSRHVLGVEALVAGETTVTGGRVTFIDNHVDGQS